LEGKNLLLIKAEYTINRKGRGLQRHISCVGMLLMFSGIIHLCLCQLSFLENINILLPIRMYCILEVYVVSLNLTEAEQILSLVLFDIGLTHNYL
jgi:hypothetical protein